MEERKYNLNDFINALKNDPTPAGPPKEIADTILQKLLPNGQQPLESVKEKIKITERLKAAKNIVKIAPAAVIIIAILIVVAISTTLRKQLDIKPAKQTDTSEFESFKQEKPTADSRLEDELRSTIDMFTANDINGLLQILSKGHFQSKLAATYYLAKIGDVRAIEPLEKLSAEYAQDEPNNLFSSTALIIINRLKQEMEIVEASKNEFESAS